MKEVMKKYGDKFQLGPVSLSIPSGIIVGIIGSNGAGKTTLLKSILNLLKVEGEIKIFGKEHDKEENLIKKDIGVVLDNMFFPEILTPNDIIKIMSSIYENWDTPQFMKYLQDFHLPLHKPIKDLSKGTRKKLEIVTALAHHPKLLILDEPTSGLDPVVRNEVVDLFLDFIQDEEHTILLSTHITSDLEHIADSIVFIEDGQIIFHKTRDEVMEGYSILRCDAKQFKTLPKDNLVRYKKNKYGYDVLISSQNIKKFPYKDCVIDKVTLEELMVLWTKGEKL